MSFVTYLMLEMKIEKVVFNFNGSRPNTSYCYAFCFSLGLQKLKGIRNFSALESDCE